MEAIQESVYVQFLQKVEEFQTQLDKLKPPYNEWGKIDEINFIFNEMNTFLAANEQFLETAQNSISEIINKIVKIKFGLLNEKVTFFMENEYLMKDIFVVQSFIDNVQKLENFQVNFISYVDLSINNNYPNVFILLSELSEKK